MTDTTRPDGAVQVPLHELLRSVPQDARLEVAISPVHVRFIPVGRLCHEAAAALAAPASKPAGITDEQIDEAIAVWFESGGTFNTRMRAALNVALSHAKPAEGGVVEALISALEELAAAGEEAWGADRPCVREARMALALAREGSE